VLIRVTLEVTLVELLLMMVIANSQDCITHTHTCRQFQYYWQSVTALRHWRPICTTDSTNADNRHQL